MSVHQISLKVYVNDNVYKAINNSKDIREIVGDMNTLIDCQGLGEYLKTQRSLRNGYYEIKENNPVRRVFAKTIPAGEGGQVLLYIFESVRGTNEHDTRDEIIHKRIDDKFYEYEIKETIPEIISNYKNWLYDNDKRKKELVKIWENICLYHEWVNANQLDSDEVIVYESLGWTQAIAVNFDISFFESIRSAIVTICDNFNAPEATAGSIQFKICGNIVVYYVSTCLKIKSERKVLLLLSVGNLDNKKIDFDKVKVDFGGIESLLVSNREPNLKADLILRKFLRSYPECVLYSVEMWNDIGLNRSASVALSPEEEKILDILYQPYSVQKTPLFIMGNAGSGKSTMLYYLYASYVFKKIFRKFKDEKELPGDIVFLTYNADLLKKARREILAIVDGEIAKKLGERQIDDAKEYARDIMASNFFTLRDFVLSHYSEQERDDLLCGKIIEWPEFKKLYEGNYDATKQYSADVAWHFIRTFVMGYYSPARGELSPENYDKIGKKHTTIPAKDYKNLFEMVWKWYKQKKIDEGNKKDQLDLVAGAHHLIANYSKKIIGVFCDEAQDLTRLEFDFLKEHLHLKTLLDEYNGITLDIDVDSKKNAEQYNHNKNFMFFAGDQQQTINPTGFSWKQLRTSLFDDWGGLSIKPIEKKLENNYRSSAPIVIFANTFQRIRQSIFRLEDIQNQKPWKQSDAVNPEVEHKEDIFEMSNFKNEIMAVISDGGDENENGEEKKKKEDMFERILQDMAIVIPAEEGIESDYIERDKLLKKIYAKKNIDAEHASAIIKSTVQCKGLEYKPTVVVYKFGEYYENNVNSKTKEDGNLSSMYFFNRLYVAMTRAMNTLLILETKEGMKFWERLSKEILDVKGGNLNNYVFKDFKLEYILTDIKTIESRRKNYVMNEEWFKSYLEQADDRNNIEDLENALRVGRGRNWFKPKQAEFYSARVAELRKDYSRAGDIYYSIEETQRSKESYWRGKNWEQLQKFSGAIKNIAEMMSSENKLAAYGDFCRYARLDDVIEMTERYDESWKDVLAVVKTITEERMKNDKIIGLGDFFEKTEKYFMLFEPLYTDGRFASEFMMKVVGSDIQNTDRIVKIRRILEEKIGARKHDPGLNDVTNIVRFIENKNYKFLLNVSNSNIMATELLREMLKSEFEGKSMEYIAKIVKELEEEDKKPFYVLLFRLKIIKESESLRFFVEAGLRDMVISILEESVNKTELLQWLPAEQLFNEIVLNNVKIINSAEALKVVQERANEVLNLDVLVEILRIYSLLTSESVRKIFSDELVGFIISACSNIEKIPSAMKRTFYEVFEMILNDKNYRKSIDSDLFEKIIVLMENLAEAYKVPDEYVNKLKNLTGIVGSKSQEKFFQDRRAAVISKRWLRIYSFTKANMKSPEKTIDFYSKIGEDIKDLEKFITDPDAFADYVVKVLLPKIETKKTVTKRIALTPRLGQKLKQVEIEYDQKKWAIKNDDKNLLVIQKENLFLNVDRQNRKVTLMNPLLASMSYTLNKNEFLMDNRKTVMENVLIEKVSENEFKFTLSKEKLTVIVKNI